MDLEAGTEVETEETKEAPLVVVDSVYDMLNMHIIDTRSRLLSIWWCLQTYTMVIPRYPWVTAYPNIRSLVGKAIDAVNAYCFVQVRDISTQVDGHEIDTEIKTRGRTWPG